MAVRVVPVAPHACTQRGRRGQHRQLHGCVRRPCLAKADKGLIEAEGGVCRKEGTLREARLEDATTIEEARLPLELIDDGGHVRQVRSAAKLAIGRRPESPGTADGCRAQHGKPVRLRGELPITELGGGACQSMVHQEHRQRVVRAGRHNEIVAAALARHGHGELIAAHCVPCTVRGTEGVDSVAAGDQRGVVLPAAVLIDACNLSVTNPYATNP